MPVFALVVGGGWWGFAGIGVVMWWLILTHKWRMGGFEIFFVHPACIITKHSV